MAGEMQSKLQRRGYSVFLDVDNIGSGAFPDQIDQAIHQCNDFLLILSPGMLDRCADEGDWVRHEIVLAEKYGKNIVGVSLPGFVRATWVGPQAERPRFPGPLLRRTRGPDPSSKATLWVKAQHEGALPPPCIVRKDPRVPHTARRGA